MDKNILFLKKGQKHGWGQRFSGYVFTREEKMRNILFAKHTQHAVTV